MATGRQLSFHFGQMLSASIDAWPALPGIAVGNLKQKVDTSDSPQTYLSIISLFISLTCACFMFHDFCLSGCDRIIAVSIVLKPGKLEIISIGNAHDHFRLSIIETCCISLPKSLWKKCSFRLGSHGKSAQVEPLLQARPIATAPLAQRTRMPRIVRCWIWGGIEENGDGWPLANQCSFSAVMAGVFCSSFSSLPGLGLATAAWPGHSPP